MNAVRLRTSEIASGSKLGIDATKKIPGEGFSVLAALWGPNSASEGSTLIKMNEVVKSKGEQGSKGKADDELWLGARKRSP